MSSSIDTFSSLSTKLGEANYHSWQPKMKALLMSKKLWLYVTGTIPQPPSDSSPFITWLENSQSASGLILLSLEESQLIHVPGMEENPQKMWSTLEDIHVQKRPNSRFMAYSTLLSISKKSDESLPSVTARIEQAMKDIKALRPRDYTLKDLDEDLSCMAMMRSLGPEFSSFVSTISLVDTITMEKLKTVFITEESNRKAMADQSSVTSASHAATEAAHLIAIICGWCNLPGHTEDKCQAKVASRNHDRNSAKQRSYARNRKPKSGSPKSPSTSTTTSTTTTPSTTSANNTETSGVPECAGHASALLSTSGLSSPSTDWCADSGASSHMTPHREWCGADYRAHVIPVKVADGNIIYSAGIGSVKFKPIHRSGSPERLVVFEKALHVPLLNSIGRESSISESQRCKGSYHKTQAS